MKKIGLFAGLLVFFALAGMASALEWTGYVGIDNLHYFGGISHSSRGEGSNVESYTLINHGTGFEITLLQGGQNVNRVSPGAADVTISLTTTATVEYSQFASDLNPNSAPTAPSSGVDITPYFSSAA